MGKSRGARRGVEEDRSTEQPLLIQGKEYTPDRYNGILVSFPCKIYSKQNSIIIHDAHAAKHCVTLLSSEHDDRPNEQKTESDYALLKFQRYR